MNTHRSRASILASVAMLAVMACSLPWLSSGPGGTATQVAATVYALQTALSTAPAPTGSATATLAPAPTAGVAPTPFPTQVPGKPSVLSTALCWQGPGPAYEVVSAVKEGTEVNILGIGSIAGWFVIENPIYHDRCWIQAKALKLDPFFNTSGLKVYNPPPTPGPTPTPPPTPTP